MIRACLPPALAAVLVLLVSGCGGSKKQPGPVDYGSGHARPHLMTEAAALAPGKPDTLGIRFDIEPGWHLFWNGQNDTGYPIHVQASFPEGFEVGELLWPAPERHESPGNILDHVYNDSVTLLLPFRAPDTLQTGAWARFTCSIQWLSCRDACVPGEDELSMTLPVIDPEGSAQDRSLWEGAVRSCPPETRKAFAAARARIPRPLGPLDAAVRWTREGRDLVIQVPGAVELAFYPAVDSAPMESILRDGVSKGETLRLRLAPDPGEAATVLGVLDISDGTSRDMFYTVRIPLDE